jgi:hypothetical protein
MHIKPSNQGLLITTVDEERERDREMRNRREREKTNAQTICQ